MKNAAIFLACMVFFCGPAFAAEMEVPEGVITTAVSDRAPADDLESAPAAVGRLYCFTRVTGGDADDVLVHVWYWGEREMARVELPVRSSDWRTWSSKAVLPDWTGEWRVEVLDGEGNLLKTIPFSLL